VSTDGAGNARLVVGTDFGLAPSNGNQAFASNGNNSAAGTYIEQTFNTVTGQTYSVSCIVGRNGSEPSQSSSCKAKFQQQRLVAEFNQRDPADRKQLIDLFLHLHRRHGDEAAALHRRFRLKPRRRRISRRRRRERHPRAFDVCRARWLRGVCPRHLSQTDRICAVELNSWCDSVVCAAISRGRRRGKVGFVTFPFPLRCPPLIMVPPRGFVFRRLIGSEFRLKLRYWLMFGDICGP